MHTRLHRPAIATFALLLSAACTSAAGAATTPPDSAAAQRVQALVEKAAALVERSGRDALAEFRKPDSEWWSGETYLFAYDRDLNVLLNPAFPQREGTNPRGEKDANGKPFHDEFLRVVQADGAGWVDYRFPRPGQSEPSQKWSYVKAVDFGGTPGILGAGFYAEAETGKKAGSSSSSDSDEQRLLELHQAGLAAHLDGDVEALLAGQADDFVLVNRGEVETLSKAQRREFFEPYLASTKFEVYRDATPPIVRISGDGSLGWVIATVEARGTSPKADGTPAVLEFKSAWIELYERRDGKWLAIGNVSTFAE